MFLKYLLVTFFTALPLLAYNLESSYFINSDEIRVSDIIKKPQADRILFHLDRGKTNKKIAANVVIEKLKSYGYKGYAQTSRFIKFTKKSPISIEGLKLKVREFYQKKYININIKKVTVTPRSYTKSLPKEYTALFQSKSHLSNKGTFYIKTAAKKKLFFNYSILASLPVYKTKKKIRRGDELSTFNTLKKSITLQKLRALPLQKLPLHAFESKRQIKADKVITQRDIQPLSIVKRGDNLSITLKNRGITISFVAKAQKNAQINDIITVLKSNGKKLRVRVTGKNRAEIQ